MPASLFLSLGIGMIFLSYFFLRFSFPFAVTSLAWGAIIVSLYLFFRHKAAIRIMEYEKLKLRMERRENMLNRLIEDSGATELQLSELEEQISKITEEENLEDLELRELEAKKETEPRKEQGEA